MNPENHGRLEEVDTETVDVEYFSLTQTHK